jgi:hypothetical protein
LGSIVRASRLMRCPSRKRNASSSLIAVCASYKGGNWLCSLKPVFLQTTRSDGRRAEGSPGDGVGTIT